MPIARLLFATGKLLEGENEYQLAVVQKIWPPINWASQPDGGGSRAWSFCSIGTDGRYERLDGSCAACRLAFCGI